MAEGLDSPNKIRAMAGRCGVSEATVRQWRQPKASEEDPNGHGKGNPIDQTARCVEVVQLYDSGFPRVIAQFFTELADQFDHDAGLRQTLCTGNLLAGLTTVITEHTDVVKVLLAVTHDVPTLKQAAVEIPQAISSLETLYAMVTALLQQSNESGEPEA